METLSVSSCFIRFPLGAQCPQKEASLDASEIGSINTLSSTLRKAWDGKKWLYTGTTEHENADEELAAFELGIPRIPF
jgi:hypothetical protein